MARYIDADKLISKLDLRYSAESEFAEQIRVQPTADVEEVKHGKWLQDFDEDYYCSVCGSYPKKDVDNYCPNCGAKMDGGKVEKKERCMMAELLPCPFCGSIKLKIESKTKNVGWTGIDARVEHQTFSVRCNKCHSRGGAIGGRVIVSHLYVYKDNMPDWAVTKEELEQKAVDLWNTRTPKETHEKHTETHDNTLKERGGEK